VRKQILTSEEHNQACADMDGMESTELGVDAMEFTTVDEYTTFKAEYAVKDEDDLVFHFFATDEVNDMADPWGYWKESFPEALNEVAPAFFKSGPPKLRAAYAEELASWWLQADGAAGKVLDPDHYARKFLEQLDGALDRRP